jgi:hypothetical protein
LELGVQSLHPERVTLDNPHVAGALCANDRRWGCSPNGRDVNLKTIKGHPAFAEDALFRKPFTYPPLSDILKTP